MGARIAPSQSVFGIIHSQPERTLPTVVMAFETRRKVQFPVGFVCYAEDAVVGLLHRIVSR